MNPVRDRQRSSLGDNILRFEKWRWIVILLVALGLFLTELYEFIELSYIFQPVHVFEILVYALLLLGMGLFLELFVRINSIHKKMLEILEYKHRLSHELSLINDWDQLAARVAQLPGDLVHAEEAWLLMRLPLQAEPAILGSWALPGRDPDASQWSPASPCRVCMNRNTAAIPVLHRCEILSQRPSASVYSLRIRDDDSPLTILRFRLPPGRQLSADEEKALVRVSDDVSVALRAGRDHKRLSEMLSVQVAMAERRLVSAYVHDRVGQNLAYLHLKLDQLAEDETTFGSWRARQDLKQLREVANDSYEIVRDILKKLQPETIPNLNNLLQEHARRIARAGNFALDFKITGDPVQLPGGTQNAIFFAFSEVLSNVEKHSGATQVEVLVTWTGCVLDISVADNGSGFDPDAIHKDEHFGLEILQERIDALKGKLMIHAGAGTGTVVSISIPT